jgi:hypothetical protein
MSFVIRFIIIISSAYAGSAVAKAQFSDLSAPSYEISGEVTSHSRACSPRPSPA